MTRMIKLSAGTPPYIWVELPLSPEAMLRNGSYICVQSPLSPEAISSSG
jgi:hypothetical protein